LKPRLKSLLNCVCVAESASRVFDVAGRIEDEDEQVELEWELMLVDVPGCLPIVTTDVLALTQAAGGNLTAVPETDMFTNFVLRCGSAVKQEVSPLRNHLWRRKNVKRMVSCQRERELTRPLRTKP
jgi:hypothetical protein